MPFDATGHALLSAEAAGLTAGVLSAHVRLAEDLLGLAAEAYDALAAGGVLARVWGEMVVLQVGHQLARGVEVAVLVQESDAGVQRTYREAGVVSPAARALRDRFFGAGAPEDGCEVDGGGFWLGVVGDG